MHLGTIYLISIVFFVLQSCSNAPSGLETISIKGSDTEVNLALSLAETFMKKHSDVSISVSGGGSGTGIAALINGKTDIANSSRSFSEKEYERALARDVAPEAIVFAMDALAIVVNENMPVDSITLKDLASIFKGEIHNWKEIGGPDLSISLYGRQSNSGTYIYFRDSVLGAEYASHLKQMNGTAQIVEAIKSDRAGIAYAGLGYVLKKDGSVITSVKTLAIKSDVNTKAISATDEMSIKNGSYPIIRPLLQYVSGVPRGKLREFIMFSLSSEGQEIVRKNGYYPVTELYKFSNNKLIHP